MALIFLVCAVAAAWIGVALVVAGLCALAARGDRTLRGAAPHASAAGGESVRRLRLIA